jgi:hypothetical protein
MPTFCKKKRIGWSRKRKNLNLECFTLTKRAVKVVYQVNHPIRAFKAKAQTLDSKEIRKLLNCKSSLYYKCLT